MPETRTITLYACNVCQSTFASEHLALDCEGLDIIELDPPLEVGDIVRVLASPLMDRLKGRDRAMVEALRVVRRNGRHYRCAEVHSLDSWWSQDLVHATYEVVRRAKQQ